MPGPTVPPALFELADVPPFVMRPSMAYTELFVLSSAQAEADFQTPGFHQRFLDDTLERFDSGDYPGLHHSLREFAALQGTQVFHRGMGILLDGFAPGTQPPVSGRKKA